MVGDVDRDEAGRHEGEGGHDRVFRAQPHATNSMAAGAASAETGAEADKNACDGNDGQGAGGMIRGMQEVKRQRAASDETEQIQTAPQGITWLEEKELAEDSRDAGDFSGGAGGDQARQADEYPSDEGVEEFRFHGWTVALRGGEGHERSTGSLLPALFLS